MNWTKLDFGKHGGKTLPQVMFSDPDWFFWAWHEGVFEGRGAMGDEAKVIYARATSIKIPQSGGKKRVVRYLINSGKFFGFDVVDSDKAAHEGTTSMMKSDHLDMEFPTTLSSYDKLGCSHLTDELKGLILGPKRKRMTKKLCEDFFSDPKRFHKSR